MTIFTFKNHVIAATRAEYGDGVREACQGFGYSAKLSSLNPDTDELCLTLRLLAGAVPPIRMNNLLRERLRLYDPAPFTWVVTKTGLYLVASRSWLAGLSPLVESPVYNEHITTLETVGYSMNLYALWYHELRELVRYAASTQKRGYATGYFPEARIPQKNILRELPVHIANLIGFEVEPPDPWAKQNRALVRLFAMMRGSSERLAQRIING